MKNITHHELFDVIEKLSVSIARNTELIGKLTESSSTTNNVFEKILVSNKLLHERIVRLEKKLL